MSTPSKLTDGLHKGRTMRTQSESVRKLFAQKAFDASVMSLRFAFNAGRTTSLFAICETLKIAPTEPKDKEVCKEELTQLILLAREQLKARLEGTPQNDTPPSSAVSSTTSAEDKPSSATSVADGTPSPAPASQPPVSSSATVVVEDVDDKGDEAIALPELTDNKRVQPFGFQIRKTRELVNNITNKKHRANLLLSQTGSGKTFMLGACVAALKRMKFFDDYRGFTPVLYVTKAPIVKQTEDVMIDCFGLDAMTMMVVNIEQLRSTLGKIFIQEQTVVVQGQEHIVFKWKPRGLPRLIIWDEAQVLKNIDSTQSRIAQALNDTTELVHGPEAHRTVQIFASATPFMRLIETKCFAVATHTEMEDVV